MSADEVGKVLSRRAGLNLDAATRGRLGRAVRAEMDRFGDDDAAYVARLERDAAALQELLDRVTVQETSFFRDPAQLSALATHVLPPLAAAGVPVQVWSAGCSNGQEPYSIAMVLAESGVCRWHVIATDISTKAIARTTAARYQDRELSGLTEERRSRHLVPGDRPGTWEIVGALRRNVSVRRHNLAADPPPFSAGACHVVFCRNVLIYFGRADVVAFLDRLSRWLPADAHLFLGYSESLWTVTDRFHMVRLGDAFVYRNGPAPVPAPAPLTSASTVKPAARKQPAPVRVLARPHIAPPGPAEVGLLAAGEAAMAAGDHVGAVTAFRKAAFLDPDQPVAHLSLGLALEASGDLSAAQRAYAAARAAFDRADPARVEASLEGYQLDELVRLLDAKAVRP